MASETTWICDWCGAREKTDKYPYPKEWATLDPQRVIARSSIDDRIERKGPGQRNEVQLFPKEETDDHTELCGVCFRAILDALKNVREDRVSKRPKK